MNVLIFLLVLLSFNLLLMFFISYVVRKNLDTRISHEINNIQKGLSISDSKISVIDTTEFLETDLHDLKETPYFLQIFDNKNNQIINSRNVELYSKIPFMPFDSIKNLSFSSFEYNNEMFRAGYLKLLKGKDQIGTLRLSVFERDSNIIIDQLILFNIISFLFIMAIVISASVFAAKKTFKPINDIINNTNALSASDLSQRINIEVDANDELGRLQFTLNNLLARIENHINDISNFSDQVSHQLMNPLTTLRTEIEYQLKKERKTEDYKSSFLVMEKQVESLIRMVKTLLTIAKTEKDSDKNRTVFNLKKIISAYVIPNFSSQVKYELEDNLYLKGDPDHLVVILHNLIENAVKFSCDRNDINVISKKINDRIELRIEDQGIGISYNDKEKIFHKFYRSTEAERLGINGYGLGLSLVRSLVDKFSGEINVSDNLPKGSVFIINLPAVELS